MARRVTTTGDQPRVREKLAEKFTHRAEHIPAIIRDTDGTCMVAPYARWIAALRTSKPITIPAMYVPHQVREQAGIGHTIRRIAVNADGTLHAAHDTIDRTVQRPEAPKPTNPALAGGTSGALAPTNI